MTSEERRSKRRRLSSSASPTKEDVQLAALSGGARKLLAKSLQEAEQGPLLPLRQPPFLQADECQYRLHHKPFPLICIDGFFGKETLCAVREQLLSNVVYIQRSSDLFSYSGTGDMADDHFVLRDSPLAHLRDCLYSKEVMRFFGDSLNVRLSLTGRPDCSSHIYRKGDFLACHDDDLRDEVEGIGRRLAFVLYLVDEWSETDGGSLDLYGVDCNGYPDSIQHCVFPYPGRLVLFEVSSISFHQVSEVLSQRCRISISGWFSGPLSQRAQITPLRSTFRAGDEDLTSFVRPTLLAPGCERAMQQAFDDQGYLVIPNFLQPEQFREATRQVSQVLVHGQRVGPASARNYVLADPPADPLLDLFKSFPFKQMLEAWTGLCLSEHRVLYRWLEGGDYSLMHDQIQDPCGLDVIFGLQEPTEATTSTPRGCQRYVLSAAVASDLDSEVLLTVPPTSNTLTLVFRDECTLKYIERCPREGVKRRVDLEGLYVVAC